MDLQQRIKSGFKKKLYKYVLTDDLNFEEKKELEKLYSDRLQAELDVFNSHDENAEKTLATEKIVKWLRDNYIAYILAGQSAASLIFWSLNITNIDPISFKLSFIKNYNDGGCLSSSCFWFPKELRGDLESHLKENNENFEFNKADRFLKFDMVETSYINFCFLSSMGVMQDMFFMFQYYSIVPPYLENIKLDNSKKAECLNDGDTYGLFKSGDDGILSSSVEVLCRALPNVTFSEFIDVFALCGQGTSRRISVYVENRNTGKYKIPHSILKPYLTETHGVLLYVEQVMAIAQDVADYSPREASLFRAILAIKNTDKINTERARFITNAKKKSRLSTDDAKKIFQFLYDHTACEASRSVMTSIAMFCYQMEVLGRPCHPD